MSAAHEGLTLPEAPPRRVEGPVRLLTFSSLYPSPGRPNHGVFVENRLRHLVGGGEAQSTVLAPVPWFPFRGGGAGQAEVIRHGLRVHHPRFVAPPGLGMLTAPTSLYATARAALARMLEQGFDFDLLDAHYLYPDGVAAIWLGQEFGKPVVITARGSDVSQLPNYRLPRRAIQRAIKGADALIAVSGGLRDGLLALGAPAEKVTVLRNGVDLDLFMPPVPRQAARAALGMGPEPVLISVGHLIERKGHHHVVAALPMLPGHRLLILGEGPERGALLALARRLGVEDRVRLVGAQPHAYLPQWYGAADAMVLASSREGWANVLLESMACGTPVVASPAWGSREAVRSPAAGLVMEETTPEAVAAGVQRLLAAPPDRAATRAYAEGFGWEETSAGQMAVFRRVLAARAGTSGAVGARARA
ncbi:glycosyltransferase family 4 protein [Roseomonas indoligenes]|uniref:Glycosyltransferase family 4 protein n=1 Tax=Roseomonas indoligenes TaxID=2820811 RepID=A0A940N8Q4_9PROT|nr:glycosyltransferase family 4 protein [Pararoseomonas indoligenes]MBP0496102.1 glycosyltransferase family 4 protein [Pararoseomonas indoligenes]